MSGRLFSKINDDNSIRRVFWPTGKGPVWDEVDFQFPSSSWGCENVNIEPPVAPDSDGAYTWLD